MKERLKILEISKENPNLIINSNSEFYGACRHKPKFHRYAITTPLPVLKKNNSSERVGFTMKSSPNFNIPLNVCTLIQKENVPENIPVNIPRIGTNPLAHTLNNENSQIEVIHV